MSYGFPYRGSKSNLAKYIVPILQAENSRTLLEPFAGGCSITDYCVRNNIFDNYIINDYSNSALLYKELTELNQEERLNKYGKWITKDEFLNTDNRIIRNIWSYNTNNRTYLFGKEIYDYYYCMFESVMNNNQELFKERFGIDLPTGKDFIERNRNTIKYITELIRTHELDNVLHQINRTKYIGLDKPRAEFISECRVIPQIKRLLLLGSSKSITAYKGDYKDLSIPDHVVIYCDPPYNNTDNSQYKAEINYNDFIDWCIEQSRRNPVYVSEIEINNPHFKLVFEKECRVGTNNYMKKRMERVYKVLDK